MFPIKKLWTAKSRGKLVDIQGHGTVYTAVTFSPDGKYVFGGGQSKRVGYWRAEDGREVGEPMELANYLFNIAVSKDGRLIACAGPSGLAEIWDVQTHKRVVKLDPGSEDPMSMVFVVDVSPDSTKFATGNCRNVSVWSTSTGQQFVGPLAHENYIAAVKFSPSGDRIATATWEHNSIRLYDSANGQLLVDIPDRASSPYNTSLTWSNDDRQLFVASHAGRIKCLHVSGSLLSWTEWNVQTDHRQTQSASIALSGNGKFIAYACSRLVSFWDTSTHAQIGPVLQYPERIWSIAISRDGYLASGGDDKKISIRNLKRVLPQSYFIDTFDHATSIDPRAASQIAIAQHDSSLAEVRRLEALLNGRNKVIEEYGREKDGLEETIRSLSTVLLAQEKNSEQLEQETSRLKATIRGLRSGLSDAQDAVRKLESESRRLTEQLDKKHESADQHKLEAERLKAAFDELRAKHEAELGQAHESVSEDKKLIAKSRSRGIGIRAFESWIQEHSIHVNTVSLEELKKYSATDYHALACRALVQARSQRWAEAYDEAQKSIEIQPSVIAHAAKAVALIGQKDYKAAMRVYALVFRDGDPDENEFMLLLWAILSCLAGEHIDGIVRVHDLVNAGQTDQVTYSEVQAYMCVLLGDRYMQEGRHERAIQLFEHAQLSCSSSASQRLDLVSLISGWDFDKLEDKIRKRLFDASSAAPRTEDAAVPPPTSINKTLGGDAAG